MGNLRLPCDVFAAPQLQIRMRLIFLIGRGAGSAAAAVSTSVADTATLTTEGWLEWDAVESASDACKEVEVSNALRPTHGAPTQLVYSCRDPTRQNCGQPIIC